MNSDCKRILRRTPRARRILGLASLAAGLILVGCSTDKTDRPAELPKQIVNRIEVKRVWSAKLSGEPWKLRLGLGVASDDGKLFGATYKGVVEAFDVNTGRRLWRRRVKAPLSGGPGVGDGLVVVGSSKGEVIALSEADGQPRWRVRVNSEILSAPAIDGDLVAVRGVDGKLHGLSSDNGSERWVVEQQVPRLSLRGTSRPLLSGDLVICGFDNGRVMAVTRASGATAWDTAVGQSHGNTELQRLIDVDAPVVADGDDLFAVAYNGRIARLARDSGQIVWSRELSSYRGMAVDADAVYVSDAGGEVVRLDRRNGTEVWRQKSLLRRELSAPAVYGGRVVVADLQGFVHWLDADTGAIVGRARVGKRRVSNAPLVADGLVLVFADGGALAALRTPAVVAANTH